MCLFWFFLSPPLSFCISQVHGQKKRKKEMHLQFYLKFIQLLKCFLTLSFDVKLSGAVDNFKLPTILPNDRKSKSSLFPTAVSLGHHQTSQPLGSSARQVSLTADNQRTRIERQIHQHCNICTEQHLSGHSFTHPQNPLSDRLHWSFGERKPKTHFFCFYRNI